MKGRIRPRDEFGMPDENFIMAIADRFGQLPSTVENELDEWWFNRIAVDMDAQLLNDQRRERERNRGHK